MKEFPNDALRRQMRRQMKDLIGKIREAEEELLRLATKERELARADGADVSRLVVRGREIHLKDETDRFLLETVSFLVPEPCGEDCESPHPRSGVLTVIGVDAAGVPILWDGQVPPGDPN